MAHEIEERDGKASFFSVVMTAWHRLGEVLKEAPKSVKEAVKLCRADYEVEVRPVAFTCYTDDGDSYPSESTLTASIVRTDTQREVGSASPDYHPMQNADAFEVFEPLVAEGLATIETGGVLRNGADAFLLVKWNLAKMGGKVADAFNDELLAYALATNSHSGRRGIGLLDTDVRVVCANTLRMAEQSKSNRVIVKHSKQAAGKVIDAAHSMWGNLIARYETVADDYDALRNRLMTEEEFRRVILDVIAPLPQESKDFDPTARFAATMVARAEEKRDTVTALWHNGKGHKGDGSVWEAYNGAVEAIDHNDKLWKSRTLDARATSLMDGPLADLKGKLFNGSLVLVGRR